MTNMINTTTKLNTPSFVDDTTGTSIQMRHRGQMLAPWLLPMALFYPSQPSGHEGMRLVKTSRPNATWMTAATRRKLTFRQARELALKVRDRELVTLIHERAEETQQLLRQAGWSEENV